MPIRDGLGIIKSMNKILLTISLVVLITLPAMAEDKKEGEDKPQPPEQVFCTMDAKMCPDGSFVGRIPPDCKFAPCPGDKRREGDK